MKVVKWKTKDRPAGSPIRVVTPVPPLKMEAILELARGIHALAMALSISTQVIVSNNVITGAQTGISIDTEEK